LDGQNKFIDPSDPWAIFPPLIPSWQCAMENFDVSTAEFVYKQVNPTDLGYVFPEPAMFLHTQTTEHQEAYFQGWL